MLVDLEIPWVIIGHSERRAWLNEANEFVGDKVAYALSKGLMVIACVGETLEREAGTTMEVVAAQTKAIAVAAECKKNFLNVTDKKDGNTFLYPFGWQEVAIEGQDKVFKDVIEPLESASVNIVLTGKQDIRDFGPPEQVVETLIKKFLAPSTQKKKLIQAKEQVVDGKAYYTFVFVAQAPNYTRHALGVISINNGMKYILQTRNYSCHAL